MKRIVAEIEFGNPKLDCNPFGICRISSTDDVIKLPMDYGVGLGSLSILPKGKIELTLYPDSLSEATRAVYFTNRILTIEEDASPYIATIFGDEWQGITFKAGRYKLDKDWRIMLDIYTESIAQPENLNHDKHEVVKNNICKCHRKAA